VSDSQVEDQLANEISEAQKKSDRPFSRDEVTEIIRSVINTIEGDTSPVSLQLYDELDALAKFIEKTKQELSLTRPDEISSKHIPTATDELDAVVGATEEATSTIMDSCEQIEQSAREIGGDHAEKLTDAVTRIYEACSFQDITGQRITKVVSTLKHIEEKVAKILEALGAEGVTGTAQSAGRADSEEEGLENGPQLPGGGIDQDEIDKLLASFD